MGHRRGRAVVLLLSLLAIAPLAVAWVPPPAEFSDVTPGSGLRALDKGWAPSDGPARSLLDVLPTGSPAAGDYNHDGFPDVFVPAARGTDADLAAQRGPRSQLFLNAQDPSTPKTQASFVDVTDVAGLDIAGNAHAASWADYDNDGWQDLFVGGAGFARLFHNARDGTFTEVTASSGLPQAGLVLGGAWGDYDRDGKLDLFLVRFTPTPIADGVPAADFSDVPGTSGVLLHNDGGSFSDVSAATGIGARVARWTSAGWVDADGDGRADLYVTALGQPAALWRNDGGTFTDTAALVGLADGAQATCQAWEDFDNDGRLDAYVAHQGGTSDSLFRSNGDGTYTDLAGTLGLDATAPGRGWGCVPLDYDGDGDMDVFVAHGGLGSDAQQSLVLMNHLDDGAGLRFTDETATAGNHDTAGFESLDTILTARPTSGALALDWNLDGAADLVTASHGHDRVRVYENSAYATGGAWAGGSGEYVKVHLVGGPGSPADGTGAVVTASAGTLSVTRRVGAGMAWGGASHTELTFGLSKPENAGYERQNKPVTITVRWPDGNVDTWTRFFATRATTRLVEGGAWQNDTVAPTPAWYLVSGTAGSPGWFTSPSVTLQLSASDYPSGGSAVSGVQSLRYSLNGATWSTASPSAGAMLTFSGEGTHKLWIDALDKAGNRAVTVLPVRIDSRAPAGNVTSPVPGSVHAQGREWARVPDPASLGRALVIAPAPLDLRLLGESGQPLQALLGSEGTQPVRADAGDGTSGVASVAFHVLRSNGVEVSGATLELAPYAWALPADRLPAGEYSLRMVVTDGAGNTLTRDHKLDIVPTTQAGAMATVQQGPSLPSL